jgi:Immunity protein 8
MRAEVRYFEWPDLERGADPAEMTSTVMIFAAGPLGGQGEETFQATVCTATRLTELVERDGVVAGRHFLFVDAIARQRVEEFVRDRLRRIDGEAWTELAEKIGRIGFWEFEDYTKSR